MENDHEHIKGLIRKGKTEQALTQAEIEFSGEHLDELLLLQNRFRRLKENRRKGLRPDEFEETAIIDSLLELIGLDKNKTNKPSNTSKSLTTNIEQVHQNPNVPATGDEENKQNHFSNHNKKYNYLRQLRIVVASPGDVQIERDSLNGVIDELNRGVAADRKLRLELARWETDSYPGFHPEGPQGLIDPLLRVDDCDVLIGIFWKRFGTPTGDVQSGTAYEIQTAYKAWEKSQRPQVMVYFSQKPATPIFETEVEQWGQVLKFKKDFPKKGLWWDYDGPEKFEDLVRGHLTNFIRYKYKL